MAELIKRLSHITLKEDWHRLSQEEVKMENDKILTLEQAFCAMFYFLEHEYELTKSDEIAIILSSLDWTVLSDNSGPPDPAAWDDWLEAVKKAKKDNPAW